MQERQMSKAKDVQRLPHELACVIGILGIKRFGAQ